MPPPSQVLLTDVRHAGLAPGITREYLLHRGLAPFTQSSDGVLTVLAAPDALLDDVDELANVYAARLEVRAASRPDVEQQIERLCVAGLSDGAFPEAAGASTIDLLDVRELASEAPVVRFVNLLLREASDIGASDIHLESTADGISVRYRLDGILVPAPEPPNSLQRAVVSRLKLMAAKDIAERRRPQDGRIRIRLADRELDLRLSTLPTIHGESLVLRLLDQGGRPGGLDDIGLRAEDLAAMRRMAKRAHGLVLVTGPTGSGKTTTLYGALIERDAEAEKLITVEDPVEYQLPNVTQVQVMREAGVTFPMALRSILRQDPDVLMIGELRDAETAELAVQAAMTGHLVFATLHTNDALGAIPRLIDLGVPSFLVAATLEGVLAQRLVRRICESCRTEYSPPPESVAAVAGQPIHRRTLMRGLGCSACRGTGFKGRVGLFELLLVTHEVRDAIGRNASRAELAQLAREASVRSLREDGWDKVQRGWTTVEEVLRVAPT